MERERIDFDVVFVGGGPACLAGAIRLMQMARAAGRELEVALIEKGANIGDHAVSGAVLNPRALKELLPDYADKGCPIESDVRGDAFYFLTAQRHYKLPMVPRQMHNAGCHIVSLARFTRWLGEMAEGMGLNIFPGFAGKQVLYGQDGRTVVGVRTGDKGLDKQGRPKANFEAGYDLMGKVTVFGEGARGSLMQEMAPVLGLFEGRQPQVFETGLKEVIKLPEENYFSQGPINDIHLMGYPLGLETPGGGFIYQMRDNRVAIGFLTALCYQDPRIDPYEAFVKFKRHPFVAQIIASGKVVEQAARTVSSGGLYSLSRLAVDGALFVGGAAGMQNMPALKGIHLSMKSGMLAAETIMEALTRDDFNAGALAAYETGFIASWAYQEMAEGRNFSQALAKKGLAKMLHLGAQYVTAGRGVRDHMPHRADHKTLKALSSVKPEAWTPLDAGDYDDTLNVDKLTGVYLAKIKHREDQPSHIIVHDFDLCIERCYPTYGSPCTRFCPGVVYEIATDEKSGKKALKLNPSNCFHCKTCDVKDPYGNITWTCPEGGEGPGYTVS
jgi:electron-transferring-flavoprotein dehydrogenase